MAKRKRDINWTDQRRELEKQVEHPYITKQGARPKSARRQGPRSQASKAVSLLVAGRPAFYITAFCARS